MSLKTVGRAGAASRRGPCGYAYGGHGDMVIFAIWGGFRMECSCLCLSLALDTLTLAVYRSPGSPRCSVPRMPTPRAC